MKTIESAFLCVFAIMAIAGCSDDERRRSSPSDDGGTDTDADGDSDTDTDSNTEQVCDEITIDISQEPARVLILQDRSSSMAGGNWDIARNAIYNLLAAFNGSSLEFGLDTLPDTSGTSCSVSAPVVVDCGPDTEAGIESALVGMTTVYSTPLYDALNNFTNPSYAQGCADTSFNRYILLIADGEDSCSGPSTAAFATLTTTLVSMGIRVIVVGFNVNVSSEQLNTIASNGGTVFTTYLNASDEPSLIAALNTVGTSIASCIFSVDEPDASADPDLVNFYLDGALIPMDEDCSSGSGWRWANAAHTQVEFCQDTCEEIGSAEEGVISATFGCDTVTIE